MREFRKFCGPPHNPHDKVLSPLVAILRPTNDLRLPTSQLPEGNTDDDPQLDGVHVFFDQIRQYRGGVPAAERALVVAVAEQGHLGISAA